MVPLGKCAPERAENTGQAEEEGEKSEKQLGSTRLEEKVLQVPEQIPQSGERPCQSRPP